MEIAIPAIGAGVIAWLIFKSKQTGQKGPDGAVYVDLNALFKGSSINKTWKSSTIPRTTGYKRVSNANISANEWLQAGYPMAVTLAAIVNADYESRLSNLATGDNGKSFGLYQLHVNGAGKGMSEADMRDASLNTRAIMADYASGNGDPVDSAYRSGATLAQLAGLFGKYVERPKNPDVIELRAAYARHLFPSIANTDGLKLL